MIISGPGWQSQPYSAGLDVAAPRVNAVASTATARVNTPTAAEWATALPQGLAWVTPRLPRMYADPLTPSP